MKKFPKYDKDNIGYFDYGYGMMVSAAQYKGQDLQEIPEELAIIGWEDKDNYYGNFVTGFYFCGVRFPKDKCRELTDDEIRSNKSRMRIHSNGLVQKDILTNKVKDS